MLALAADGPTSRRRGGPGPHCQPPMTPRRPLRGAAADDDGDAGPSSGPPTSSPAASPVCWKCVRRGVEPPRPRRRPVAISAAVPGTRRWGRSRRALGARPSRYWQAASSSGVGAEAGSSVVVVAWRLAGGGGRLGRGREGLARRGRLVGRLHPPPPRPGATGRTITTTQGNRVEVARVPPIARGSLQILRSRSSACPEAGSH